MQDICMQQTGCYNRTNSILLLIIQNKKYDQIYYSADMSAINNSLRRK